MTEDERQQATNEESAARCAWLASLHRESVASSPHPEGRVERRFAALEQRIAALEAEVAQLWARVTELETC